MIVPKEQICWSEKCILLLEIHVRESATEAINLELSILNQTTQCTI